MSDRERLIGILTDPHDRIAQHDDSDELAHRWRDYKAQLTEIELAAIIGPIDELTYEEIAEANHCSAKRIDNARERAKEKRDLFLAGEGMRERMKEERRQSRNT
jgi:DNA-directed RNA polymerase specialized sigma24 family protein